ncbi:hypothetical protein L207DRAFT_338522 [Hyaloscypha variabilis F]|uniref:Uncharacterized protein n=1 Tax=Hyaloscypha variabilis (strain UAMH 11265 / GT02V1 / F) TaxID=1149755 RepID=A0A2J6RPK4_HYAVF|nr:hypothetical protein L207DRAFT_338522 [Hyaloscypha variabilis F]
MSRSVFPFHLPWKSTTPPPPDINTMVDKEDSQQRGRQLGLLSPKKRGQSMHPNGSAQAPQTPPPATRASSTAFGAFMSPLRRLAPAAASVPVPPPKPEPAPMPEAIRAPPSVRIPPIRRMAPQRGTTGRPAREEPLLRPPPPNRQRARNSVERDRTFVTNQCKLLPLYLGRPREEQDRMLERLAPRPRDITLLPPLSMSSSSSSLKLPVEKLLSDIPPPMSLRDDAQVPQLGFDLSSSSSTADASLNIFYSPSTPMFGPPLKQPYPSSAPVTPEENGPRVADLKDQPPVYQLPSNPPLSPERPSFIGSVSNAIPRPQPADQQTDLSLEDPFEHLNSASKPRTPLPGTPLQRSSSLASPVTPSKRHPQLPYPAHIGSSRGRVLSSGRRKSGTPKEISQTKVKPGAYRPRFLPPYRPKTPPAGWFLSQNQVNALCRSASLPEIPIVGDKTFAERSLEENPFRPGPIKRDFEPLPVGPPRKPVNMDTIKPYQPLAAKNDIQASKNGLRPIPSDKFQQKKLASKAPKPEARESNLLSFPRDLPQLPARDPIPPVKFVDYTEMPNPQYTKFSHGRGPRILMEKERPGPFGTGEAKVFALKLLTAVSHPSVVTAQHSNE